MIAPYVPPYISWLSEKCILDTRHNLDFDTDALQDDHSRALFDIYYHMVVV